MALLEVNSLLKESDGFLKLRGLFHVAVHKVSDFTFFLLKLLVSLFQFLGSFVIRGLVHATYLKFLIFFIFGVQFLFEGGDLCVEFNAFLLRFLQRLFHSLSRVLKFWSQCIKLSLIVLDFISHDFALIFIEHRCSLEYILGKLILLFIHIFIVAFKSHKVIFYSILFINMVQKLLLNVIEISLDISHIGILFGSNRLVYYLVQ